MADHSQCDHVVGVGERGYYHGEPWGGRLVTLSEEPEEERQGCVLETNFAFCPRCGAKLPEATQ